MTIIIDFREIPVIAVRRMCDLPISATALIPRQLYDITIERVSVLDKIRNRMTFLRVWEWVLVMGSIDQDLHRQHKYRCNLPIDGDKLKQYKTIQVAAQEIDISKCNIWSV